MKRRKKKQEPAALDPPPLAPDEAPTLPYFHPPTFEPAPRAAEAGTTWDGPTRVALPAELAELAAHSTALQAEAPAPAEEPSGPAPEDTPAVDSGARLESIVESLLFASDRPLTVAEIKRLLGERDTKKVVAALEALAARHQETGIQLAGVAGGWQFRTHPDNGAWVAKLVAGRPQRLSRAMLEALAIVAYRQPITRPEIDEIRGVDCGPVLKTLLDRGLVRIIGKREDVGRPILYGTTPDFLRVFSLKDLAELPTLREFHELSEAHMAEVDARSEGPATGDAASSSPPSPLSRSAAELPGVDPIEEDGLISELERASAAAATASAARGETGAVADDAGRETSESAPPDAPEAG